MDWKRSAQIVLPCTVVLLLSVFPGLAAADPPRPVALHAVRISEEAAAAPVGKPSQTDEVAEATAEAGNGTREGGETCASALVIGALPFNDTGDTRNNINDIESPNCEDATLE